MVERNYGYITATFWERDTESFQKLTKAICNEDDLYYSDTEGYIKGNVSSDLHMTLFYGFINERIDREKLQLQIDKIQIRSLKLNGLFLRQIPGKPYQIIWIVVVDDEGRLQSLSEKFKKFDHDDSVQLEFMPHLTLAYVKPDFKLKTFFEYPKKIKIKEIKYFNQ